MRGKNDAEMAVGWSTEELNSAASIYTDVQPYRLAHPHGVCQGLAQLNYICAKLQNLWAFHSSWRSCTPLQYIIYGRRGISRVT